MPGKKEKKRKKRKRKKKKMGKRINKVCCHPGSKNFQFSIKPKKAPTAKNPLPAKSFNTITTVNPDPKPSHAITSAGANFTKETPLIMPKSKSNFKWTQDGRKYHNVKGSLYLLASDSA